MITNLGKSRLVGAPTFVKVTVSRKPVQVRDVDKSEMLYNRPIMGLLIYDVVLHHAISDYLE